MKTLAAEKGDPMSQALTAIDPSINHIALAHLSEGRIVEATTIHTKAKGDARYEEITDRVWLTLTRYHRDDNFISFPVIIEYPDSWHRDNVKDLLKLTTAIGCIHATAILLDHEVHLIGVKKWKGTKSKATTARELEMMGYDLKTLKWNEHERDAARLALWAEGWLRMSNRKELQDENNS